MLHYQDILSAFYYLNQKYNLSDGIYIELKNAVPSFQYIWPVEESNLIFKFSTIEEFMNAYSSITSSNTEINTIIYKSTFITLKYIVSYNRIFISTESFNDISHLHDILNQKGVKEIIYKFKNYNN